jgi:Putative methionine and alanine importer, small subunit
MTPIAITFLILAIIVVWGGLVASTLYLRRRPELTGYPPGDTDDHREDDAPIIHDT